MRETVRALLRTRRLITGGDGRGAPGARYDAFISYSHSQSRLVAEALQADLERFAKPWYRARRLRVFRDETNLAAAPQLWPMIEEALGASDWFVLMASPEASRSRWVRREVEWWRANRPADRILIAQTAGEIAWAGDDFDWNRTDALPRALAGAFTEEPLWVDLRTLVPGPSVTAEGEDVSDRRVQLGDLVAEFAAPIHGIAKDSLIGAHIRQHRRTRRTVQSVIITLSILLVAATVAGIVAVLKRDEAIHQRNVAEARRIAAQADALREQRPDVSLMLAVQALKIAPVTEAHNSLAATLAQSHYAGSLVGHNGQINGIAVNPTGRGVATASGDHTVVLWDTADYLHRVRLATLTGFDGPVDAVDFDSSGRLLAAGGPLGKILLWDVSDLTRPRRVAVFSGDSDLLRFSPRGHTLFAADALWDVSDPSHPVRLATLPGGETVRDVDISADGRTLVVAARPAATTLWDISNPRHPFRLAELPDLADAAALSPNGELVVIAPEDGPARMWNIQDRTHPVPVGTLAGLSATTVFDAAFSPDGTRVATAESDGTAVWNLQDLAHPEQTNKLHGHQSAVLSVAFGVDGRSLVTGGLDGVAMLWSLADQRRVVELARLGPFTGAPEIVRFSPDRRTFITAGLYDPITVWDIADREHPVRLATIGTEAETTHNVAVSPDGTMLVHAIFDQPPVLWDITDPSHPASIGPVGDVPGEASFAPDGRTLVRYGGDGGVDLWDISQRGQPVRIGAVGPAGDKSGDKYRTWAVFSPDGQTLAIAGNDTTVLWNVTDRAHPTRLATMTGVGRWYVAFRPDGRFLAVDGPGVVLSLWDVSRPDRPTRVSSVAGDNFPRDGVFSPDGLVIATGSPGAVGTLWNVSNPASPTQLALVTGHAGSVYNVAIDFDGRTLATGSYDLTARLWDMPAAIGNLHDPVAVACALAGPGLSTEDWQNYLAGLPQRTIC